MANNFKFNNTIKSLRIWLASPEQIRGSRPWKIDSDSGLCTETWLDRKDDRGWSYGEITQSDTINPKNHIPEPGGLFDPVIFGPEVSYSCQCGKYKKRLYAGQVCEKCHVEVINSIVRRERMAHIELAAPVAHIWMYKEAPSAPKIGLLLNLKQKEVDAIVNFQSYIVCEAPANNPYNTKIGQVINFENDKNQRSARTYLRTILAGILKSFSSKSKSSDEYIFAEECYNKLKEGNSFYISINYMFELIKEQTGIYICTGSEALLTLLKNIDLQKTKRQIEEEIALLDHNSSKISNLINRLELVSAFISSGIKPSNMILTVLPVLPAGLRPIPESANGMLTTGDLNSLYKNVIIRNNRLKEAIAHNYPANALNNEKKLLQQAVDALFENPKVASFTSGPVKKSITERLNGKTGIFRQNLLGKRVDFSARSVIVVDPSLKLYEVGLPLDIVLKLYRPFIISNIIESLSTSENKVSYMDACEILDHREDSIWPIVYKVVKERPVLLNRAPSLHRLSFQAFEVKVVFDKAIKLHPLACEAFNADFDGDQMAVHLPMSDEAVAEARSIMLASWHIIAPKDGNPVVTPQKDMVLGAYVGTRAVKGSVGEGKVFATISEVEQAIIQKVITYNTIIGISTSAINKPNLPLNSVLITTAGMLLFNDILPKDLFYINDGNSLDVRKEDILPAGSDISSAISSWTIPTALVKKSLGKIVKKIYNLLPVEKIGAYIDNIKEITFEFVTRLGGTISNFDLPKYTNKEQYFQEAMGNIQKFKHFYQKGLLTEDERYSNVIKTWSNMVEKVNADMKAILEDENNSYSAVIQMIKSGARGNLTQFSALLGMKGLVNKSYNYEKVSKSGVVKDTIETPVSSSLIEGVSPVEYFNSAFGSRKATADTAMKTPKSGYTTRKLVDAAQEVIVTEEDCHCSEGLKVTKLINKNNAVFEKLSDRIIGKYAFSDVEKDGSVYVKKDELITPEIGEAIEKAGIEEVYVRSPIYCTCKRGVCQKCFGTDLSTSKVVELGTPVGIITGQSIGEPATQLNMRSKHTGGIAGGGGNIAQGFERLHQLLDIVPPKSYELAIMSEVDGNVTNVVFDNNSGNYTITVISNNKEEYVYKTNNNHNVIVKVGDNVVKGQNLVDGSKNIRDLLKICGIQAVREYIFAELSQVYRLQGIEVSDKYLEVIIAQMTNKITVTNPGDSSKVVGAVITRKEFIAENNKLLSRGKKPIVGFNMVVGIDEVPSYSESFLASASFQYTKSVLADACVAGAIDELKDIKANVILGNLIPAGTGLKPVDEILKDGEIAYKKEW